MGAPPRNVELQLVFLSFCFGTSWQFLPLPSKIQINFFWSKQLKTVNFEWSIFSISPEKIMMQTNYFIWRQFFTDWAEIWRRVEETACWDLAKEVKDFWNGSTRKWSQSITSTRYLLYAASQTDLGRDVVSVLKPNSWTNNFVEVFGPNLESSQTWGLCIDFVKHRERGMVFYQIFLLSTSQYSNWTEVGVLKKLSLAGLAKPSQLR
jgi:hypothetical protein